MHIDHDKSQSDDSLYQPGEGSLVRQLGAEDGRVRACGDLAVVELRAQRSARLAAESDLICVWSHWDYASQSVVDAGRQSAWRRGLCRHPLSGDPGLDAMAAAWPHRQEGPVGLGGLHPLLSCPLSAAPMLTRIKRARGDRHAAQHSLQSAWPDGLTL
jgi:hypothetical protein